MILYFSIPLQLFNLVSIAYLPSKLQHSSIHISISVPHSTLQHMFRPQIHKPGAYGSQKLKVDHEREGQAAEKKHPDTFTKMTTPRVR
jgi:hypothetical protein